MEIQLQVLAGRTTSTEITLRKFPLTVGRHRESQLRITSRLVSRRHCRFDDVSGVLLVTDLNSSNGTYINGRKIEEPTLLHPGDTLDIGPISFEVRYLGDVGGVVNENQEGRQGANGGNKTNSPGGVVRDELPTIITDGIAAEPGEDLADTFFQSSSGVSERQDQDEAIILKAFQKATPDLSAADDDLSWLDSDDGSDS
ncbi:MAG: FHA domain-containing protein [Planctomycetota bacterium]